eukprot:scaffold16231_cov79-Isochrysis_galbana.AAC.1
MSRMPATIPHQRMHPRHATHHQHMPGPIPSPSPRRPRPQWTHVAPAAAPTEAHESPIMMAYERPSAALTVGKGCPGEAPGGRRGVGMASHRRGWQWRPESLR